MVTYSNIFDLLRKIIIGSVAMLLSFPAIIGFLDNPNTAAYTHFPESSLLWWVVGIGDILWRFGLFFLIAWLLATWVITNTFHSLLYIRFSLFTPVTIREARELAPLFSVGPAGKWFPCREVRDLPKGERKAFLYEALEKHCHTLA